MDFINSGTGRPRPKAGYRCKICGKEGGQADSHWYQLCPYKGKSSDKRTFNPPRKGYLCKFCHKTGGEPDSHWFQQCPRRHEFEGIQVPHPLKLRAAANPNLMNMLPQSLQTAAMMNLGVMPNTQHQIDYSAQQFTTNGMGIFMYPNQQQIQQISQQQMYFLQQQLAQQQQGQFGQTSSQGLPAMQMKAVSQQSKDFGAGDFDLKPGAERAFYDRLPGQQRFMFEQRQQKSQQQDGDNLLNELTKQAQELSFNESPGAIDSAVAQDEN